MKALSQTAYVLVTAGAMQLLAMSAAHASDRSKPYLTADAQGPAPLVHESEPDLSASTQPAVQDVGTEQLEKLLLHSALADSSAFGLLQALQSSRPAPAATPSTSASKPASDCGKEDTKGEFHSEGKESPEGGPHTAQKKIS